jgi:diguanylate cyclase (GGDEF)-like protein
MDSVSRELRLLILEDAAAEAELAVRQLKSAGMPCVWQRVERETEFRKALKDWQPDIILSDFTLPQFDGLTALAISAGSAPDIPFIFLSGTLGEERAIEALKRGAVDYVLKTNLARLPSAVRRALEEVESRRARRAAEERVARLTRVLQMLSGINTAVVRIRDRDELLNEACRLAHQVGAYEFAFIALLDPGTRTARPVACAGERSQTLVDAIFTVADSALTDTSVTGRVLRTGQAVVCADDLVPTSATMNRKLIVAPVPTVACLPLIVDATTVGAFMFGSPGHCAVSEEELLLLQEVAANLSFAIQYLEKQDAVRYLSYFDPHTGLAKRPLFCERLSRLLSSDGAAPRPTVAVFDIEHMSAINDSLSRPVGDLLLQSIADRLKQHLGGTEHLAHLGGGTFASVICQPMLADDALQSLQDQVTAVFNEPFHIEGKDIPVTVKSGFARYPDNGEDANSLVQNAEAALKTAKASGERWLSHRREMNSALTERRSMEHRLRIALERNQFVLHYQPKLTLASDRIAGVEALLRWADPERGLIAPGLFLPTLEASGLIAAVGEWALVQAAADSRRWHRLGLPPLRVAVNAAPSQLRRRDYASKVLEAAAGFPTDNGWGLDLELTEGALLEDSAWCIRTLRVLRGAGVRIAIDDFGTGYSSLARLSQLPVDTLKIDRYFTSRVPEDAGSCTLVTAIIGLARAFNMTTVGEGVETEEQLAYLRQAGCHETQGYFHSRPIGAAELENLLLSQEQANLLQAVSHGWG